MKLTDALNELLGTIAVYYQNVKSFHWLIKGKNFLDLHDKYGELYEAADEDLDMIAERILMIKGTPIHTYEEFIKASRVKAEKNIAKDVTGVDLTIKNYRVLIKLEKEIIELAKQEGDEATMDMMIKLIACQEKQLWMLDSWMS